MVDTQWGQSPLQPPAKSAKKGSTKPHNFIEALKDLGGGVKDQGKAATAGILSQAVDQMTGKADQYSPQTQGSADQFPQPQMPFNFAEYLKSRENLVRQQERQLAEQQRSGEKLVFHRKEEEAKQQVELIKTEIKKLIVETGQMSVELQQAEQTVMTTTVEPGTYHLNFFDRIRRLIALARKRISESRNWLELFNSRQQQRSYYWGQVQKSGTKFMLSHERYMATQAG
jgi:hypothetical protein